jgi:Uma2 family endonuclease
MASLAASPSMTGAEFIRDFLGQTGYELVRGQLVETSPMPGLRHDEIEGNAYFLLRSFVKANSLGRVACGETKIRLARDPDTYRCSDVMFISYAKLPASVPTPEGPLEIAPDLVVEIRSPSDRPDVIDEKVAEYLDAGVTVVMTIDPDLESISVHRRGEIDQRFHNGDTVTLPDVLPGFAAHVKAFFE